MYLHAHHFKVTCDPDHLPVADFCNIDNDAGLEFVFDDFVESGFRAALLLALVRKDIIDKVHVFPCETQSQLPNFEALRLIAHEFSHQLQARVLRGFDDEHIFYDTVPLGAVATKAGVLCLALDSLQVVNSDSVAWHHASVVVCGHVHHINFHVRLVTTELLLIMYECICDQQSKAEVPLFALLLFIVDIDGAIFFGHFVWGAQQRVFLQNKNIDH